MAAGKGGEGGREGYFSALKNLVTTLVVTGKTRLELLVTEVEEEKIRFLDLLVSALATLFLFGLGLVLAVACAAAAFWEYRIAVFGISAGVVLFGAAVFLGRVRAAIAQPSQLFKSSLAELGADKIALEDEAVPGRDGQ